MDWFFDFSGGNVINDVWYHTFVEHVQNHEIVTEFVYIKLFLDVEQVSVCVFNGLDNQKISVKANIGCFPQIIEIWAVLDPTILDVEVCVFILVIEFEHLI